ncbi:MAG: EamA family transporter [Rhodothermaceae bacterium]|nr:EamA family transporter [Rhodothermaceae bacterium]
MIRLPKYTTLILAFIAVYFIWGSTYLAIRIAIETMPPLTMLGFRFGVAGLIMLAWLTLRGVQWPSFSQWRTASMAGGLMLFAGTGTVAVALQYVPSGLAALVITTVPLWMVLLNWLWKKGPRPTLLFFVGFFMGLIGVFLLVDPSAFLGTQTEGVIAIIAIMGGSVCWAVGSLYGRDADTPSDPFMATAIQMTMGGVILCLGGAMMGERIAFTAEMLTMRSLGAWLYLLIFGSFIAFSAYIWLMKNTSPAKVSTYAYVNPVIAVYLGWAFAGEPITPQIILASLLLVSAVVIVLRYGTAQERGKVRSPEPGVRSIEKKRRKWKFLGSGARPKRA